MTTPQRLPLRGRWLALLAASMIAGCSSGDGGAARNENEILLGHYASMTGGQAIQGAHPVAKMVSDLLANGVPDEYIRREVDAHNSWESLAAVARILEDEGVDEVILVSDPYHSYRVGQIADELGMTPHLSPTRSSPTSAWSELRSMARETLAVSVGRFVGYRRLVRIDDQVGRLREGGGGG